MSENLFEAFAAVDGTRPVIRGIGGLDLKYSELFAMSGRIANALIALGAAPRDRVCVQVEKTIPALALYLAVLRVGAVFLRLNTGYTISELDYFISDSEPSVIVCDPGVAASIEALGNRRGRVVTLDATGRGTLMELADTMPEAFSTVPCERDDLATILYTSGTPRRLPTVCVAWALPPAIVLAARMTSLGPPTGESQ